jgi:hypothetical protein
MLKIIRYHAQGFALGVTLTLCACAYLYLQTHTIKFSSTATNQPLATIQAENDAVAMAQLMPPLPPHKPPTARAP